MCHEITQVLIEKKKFEPFFLPVIPKIIHTIFCIRGGMTRNDYRKLRNNFKYKMASVNSEAIFFIKKNNNKILSKYGK